MSYGAPTITRDKARSDVVEYLRSIGISVEVVSRCSGNVEYMDGYGTYYYGHEWSTVQAILKDFIESKFKPMNAKKVYVWFSLEANYRYLNVGFFARDEDGLLILRKIVLGVPLH